MARFCAHCGKPMGDTDRVCGFCGTPAVDAPAQPGAPAPAFTQPGAAAPAPAAGATKMDTNTIIKLVAAGIAAIVVLVILTNVIGAFTGYKGAIRKTIKAFQNYDMATLSSMASSINEEAYSWTDNLDDLYDEKVSDSLDDIEDDVGTIKKMSFEITDETELSDRRLNDLKDTLIDDYNMDVSGIKKVLNVSMKLTVKGSNKTATYNVRDLLLIKERGGWKLLYGGGSLY